MISPLIEVVARCKWTLSFRREQEIDSYTDKNDLISEKCVTTRPSLIRKGRRIALGY